MGESRANEPAIHPEHTSPPAPSREPGWFVPLVVVAGLVALIAVAAGVGVARMGPPPPQYAAPGTASAAVMDYVGSLRKGDYESAESLISARVKAESEDWQKLVSISQSRFAEADARIVTESGDSSRATVVVEITTYAGSGLSRTVTTHQSTIPLVREDGGWKIDTADLGSI